MDSEKEKEVFFNVYCETCKHKNLSEHDDICNECLENPSNINSHKPVKYEKKDK